MSNNRSLVFRALIGIGIGITIVVAMVGCNKASSEIKVNDPVFVQPYTIQFGEPFNGGSNWVEATVTAIKGDSATIKPGPHWNDVAGGLSDPTYKVKKDILVKKIPLTAKEVKIAMPVIVWEAAYDTNYVFYDNGIVAKVEGDSISVAYRSDQAPETTKVGINRLWANPPKPKK